ncbi:hypothetical protein PUN28_000015 [Cardiocondyla obscurior]|uniref:Uncharacterized protein n=1 Tax=Cardiocondyla obscurior TaxID=286306 RepID=A0AAW2GXB5_9HYME
MANKRDSFSSQVPEKQSCSHSSESQDQLSLSRRPGVIIEFKFIFYLFIDLIKMLQNLYNLYLFQKKKL